MENRTRECCATAIRRTSSLRRPTEPRGIGIAYRLQSVSCALRDGFPRLGDTARCWPGPRPKPAGGFRPRLALADPSKALRKLQVASRPGVVKQITPGDDAPRERQGVFR